MKGGVTKATCPFNKDAKKPNPKKHNKNTFEDQKKEYAAKYIRAREAARKSEKQENDECVREILPSISFPVKSWEEIKNNPVDTRDCHKWGFRIVLENNDVVLFTMSSENTCCEKIDVRHILSPREYDFTDTIFSEDGGLMLLFPDGNTFMLENDHNGYYPHRCFFELNGKPVFKFPVCI